MANAMANKSGSNPTKTIEIFRTENLGCTAVCLYICRDNHFYTILMRNEKDTVEIFVIDSAWTGHIDKTWPGCGLKDKKADPEMQALELFKDQPTNGRFYGLNAIMRYTLCYIASILWPSSKPNRRVVYKYPLVPHQGTTLDCGLHVINHIACMVLQPDRYFSGLERNCRITFDRRFI